MTVDTGSASAQKMKLLTLEEAQLARQKQQRTAIKTWAIRGGCGLEKGFLLVMFLHSYAPNLHFISKMRHLAKA